MKKISIYQGKQSLDNANVNIVIDVLRAFTVSDYAFQQGVKHIILAANNSQAFALRDENTYLSGEKNGYKITEFDYGNSPYELSQANLQHKTLVQKTTNGVAVTLDSLNATYIFVTGYSNAFTTAMHACHLDACTNINIIASHPSGDEDLACAEYIKKIILNDYDDLQSLEEETVYRILNSKAASKFQDEKNKEFSILDLSLCAVKSKNNFVMKVENKQSMVTIVRDIIK